jgi:hypothetical protein
MKVIFDLKLPEGTKCIALTTLEPLCVVGAFDIPERGIEIYVLNPNTGNCVKVEGWKE